MATNGFFDQARQTYDTANASCLNWMLDRPALKGVFLNTKVNSITGLNYADADGRRGPDWVYGWIQGRGLEALCAHSVYFKTQFPALGLRLNQRAQALYKAIGHLVEKTGHAYFCYDKNMQPTWSNDKDNINLDPSIYTYSDAFCAKGLVAAAAQHDVENLSHHLSYLARVIQSVEDGFFQIDENVPSNSSNLLKQKKSFGPYMILLGAAELVKNVGHSFDADYAYRFIDIILKRHLDLQSYLLRDVEKEDECNPGHAIEFVGFALEFLPNDADPALLKSLEKILLNSFEKGFKKPGICLSLSIQTGLSLSPNCPWWSLPETIRAAALLYERTHSSKVLAVWKTAHEAFFEVYWQQPKSIAYQTMTSQGPVDFVPATPDLDPGYHTGLSLLCASKVAAQLSM